MGRPPRRDADIYGARIDANVNVLDPGGDPISTASGDQLAPRRPRTERRSTSRGATGGLGSTADIYGQRVTGLGRRLNGLGGFPISRQPATQQLPDLARLGSNVVTVWQDNRAGSWDVYGTRCRRDQSADVERVRDRELTQPAAGSARGEAPSARLGEVHRMVRAPNGGSDVVTGRGSCNSDTAGRLPMTLVPDDRVAEDALDPPHDEGFLGEVRRGAHEHELVASVSSDRVAGTEGVTEAFCDAREHEVARVVSVVVVDFLEAVQVQERDDDAVGVFGHLRGEMILERVAVQEAGERVVARGRRRVIVDVMSSSDPTKLT